MWLEDFGGSKLEKDAPWILAQLEPKHPQSWNFSVIELSPHQSDRNDSSTEGE